MATEYARMQQRRGTATEWTTANPVLMQGELGFDTTNNRFKIGDGITPWSGLPSSLSNSDMALIAGYATTASNAATTSTGAANDAETARDEAIAAAQSVGMVYPSRAVAEASSTGTTPHVAIIQNGIVLWYVYDEGGTAFEDADGRTFSPGSVAVYPGHFAANTTPGTTDMTAALLAASDYVANNEGRCLIINEKIGISTTVDMKARWVACPGVIVPLVGFEVGSYSAMVRLGGISISSRERANIELAFDGENVLGLRAGTWNPATGAFPSGASEGDTFVVIGDRGVKWGAAAGTVDGQAFTVGQRLVALVNSPSTGTFADDWTVRAQIACVEVNGMSEAGTSINVDGRQCDTVLVLDGNTERTGITVSGTDCACIISELRSSGEASTDNNVLVANGRNFGCAYWSAGSCYSKVDFNCQSQLPAYLQYPIKIDADRYTSLGGLMRGCNYGLVQINQVNVVSPGVHFNSLECIHSSTATADVPWLDVVSTGTLSGFIWASGATNGVKIDLLSRGGTLIATSQAQNAGKGLVLGVDGVSSVARLNMNFNLDNPDGAVTIGMELPRAPDCVVRYTGSAKVVTIGTASIGLVVELPNDFLLNDVEVVPANSTVKFIGGVELPDLLAYSYGARGMEAMLYNSIETPIYYTGRGDGWQVPMTTNGDSNGQTVNTMYVSISPNGTASSWDVVVPEGVVIDKAFIQPITALARGLVVVHPQTDPDEVKVAFYNSSDVLTAPPVGTDTLQFYLMSLS